MRLLMQYCLDMSGRLGLPRGARLPDRYHGDCHPRIRCLFAAKRAFGCCHYHAGSRLRVPCRHRCVHPWNGSHPGSRSSVRARLPSALAIDPRNDTRRNPRRRVVLLDRPCAPGQDRRCVAFFIAAGHPGSRREILRKVWLGGHRSCTFPARRTRNRSGRGWHERHETATLLRGKCRLCDRLGPCAPDTGGTSRLWHCIRRSIEPSGRNLKAIDRHD